MIDDADEEDAEAAGFYYLLIPDQSAFKQIESLWRRWKSGDDLAGFAPMRDLFACLHTIRRWSAQDRVSSVDSVALRALAQASPDRQIGVEIELVFRANEGAAMAAEREVLQAVVAAGGQLLDRARHSSFSSHVVLVSLPATHVIDIADRGAHSLAGVAPILSISPQSLVDADFEPEIGRPLIVHGQLPGRDPIAALFDAVPVQEHAFLAGRLIVDDPDGLEGRSVGLRVHGTAMASLILHGDLNRPSDSLERPLYVRPLMFAPTAGSPKEVFPNDRLVVDRFYDAVVRMKNGIDGVPATAPGVIVVNVSLGDKRRRFSGRLSRWARALDDLAWRYGILFVVSAGNLDLENIDDVPVPGFANQAAFEAAPQADRSRAILAGLRDVIRDRALLAPADSVNALTVGAAHDDAIDPPPPAGGPSVDPFPTLALPNITSAPGPGFARAVKPEILMPGGRERVLLVQAPGGLMVRGRAASHLAGLKVASPPRGHGASLNSTTFVGQTSAAAALATRTAHRIHDALENAYGPAFMNLEGRDRALVLKTLLVHPARWTDAAENIVEVFGPAASSQWQKRRANVARLLGFGVVDSDEAIFCASNRATAWAVGTLRGGQAAVFRLPLPPALSGQVVQHSIAATLAWFTPTIPGRQTYRQVRLTIADPPADELGRLGVAKSSAQPDQNAARRGTVIQRRFSGSAAAALVEQDVLLLKVQREPDQGTPIDEAIPFAIAVSVEADGGLPIYEQVAARLVVRPAVQAPVAIRVEDTP